MKYNTLDALGTAICDAIREKINSEDLIPMQEVPDKIALIQNEIIVPEGFGISRIDIGSNFLNNLYVAIRGERKDGEQV